MTRKRKNERTDGRIQLSVVTGRDAEGKLTRKYFYGYTRIEAQRKKDEYLQTVQAVKPRRLTVAQWIDEYREIYPSKANPLYKAQNDVPFKRLSAAIGNRMIDTIIEADLQKFMNTMGVYSASTIAKQIQVTKAVFAKARKNKLIPDDPSEYITPPTGTKGTHRALTRQEINQILEKWQSVGNAGLWVMVMLFAGLRRGEMMALNWNCVDMTERTLTVRRVGVLYHNQMVVEERTKTRAGARIIPIVRPLFDALSTIQTDRRNGLVCRSAQDNALSETAIRRGVQHFAHVTGVSFRCHDLRHTFCTLLYDSGTDVQTAAYLMGHSDVSVTMKIYTHLSEERKARSTVALTDYFSGLMMSE